MTTEVRKTGDDVVGHVPWGTHCCLFYETKADALDITASYCKAGLESREFCLWVVAEPLTPEDATRALAEVVPDLERYRADAAFEIVAARDWYLRDGTFDMDRVIRGWNEKLANATARGYAGIRVAGDTAWLEKHHWKDFREYEDSLNEAIAHQRMAVMCTYPLAACGASEILDVVRTHQFAVAKRHGNWEVIETAGHKQAKSQIERLNDELEQRVVERTSQLTAAQARLRQAEKMEALGRLAGGIAHDFNNILGGILGYSEMLVEETPANSGLNRYSQNVLTAATRARELVDQILTYSRSERNKRVAVDLGRVVAETLELVRGSLAEGVRLEARLPAGPVPVIGDATQLHQVVMNLCMNAVQAMPDGGRLTVTLAETDLDLERACQHGMQRPGSYADLTVEDSGRGMDEATIARIFEPFFTTKDAGKSTGLGLALVFGIVTGGGGAIDVRSVIGRGSVFTIHLPRVDASIEADQDPNPSPRGHGERVLVIENEESVLAVTSEVLARLGYRPRAFSDSRAALAEFESQPGEFGAVITDEAMPELTGTELAQRIHRRHANLPVVLVSGHVGPMTAERAAAAGVTEILKKPVRSHELAAALARALDKAKQPIKTSTH